MYPYILGHTYIQPPAIRTQCFVDKKATMLVETNSLSGIAAVQLTYK
jgi:hypothetical protein